MLAVYDGVGGAGARSVGFTPDQQEVSGAFVASRVAHFALEDWFVTSGAQRPIADSAGLESAILARLRATGITRGSKVIGTMVRHLPTTLAAIEYELIGLDLNLVSRWAGDSRAYILDPAEGLLTLDDAGGAHRPAVDGETAVASEFSGVAEHFDFGGQVVARGRERRRPRT